MVCLSYGNKPRVGLRQSATADRHMLMTDTQADTLLLRQKLASDHVPIAEIPKPSCAYHQSIAEYVITIF